MCREERTKRIISLVLTVMMLVMYIPEPAFAEDTGLCEHHATHENCGYAVAVAGVHCSHEHGDDCDPAGCTHAHDDSCGYVAAVEAAQCDFVCGECTAVETEATMIPEETTESDDVFAEQTILATEPEAYAVTEVAINDTRFPDPVFRQYVQSTIDRNKDGYLSAGDIIVTKTIDVSKTSSESTYNKIADLTGIEYFYYLEELRCEYNLLSYLDVSQNVNLKTLTCSANQLAGLDVGEGRQLENLFCSFNRLTSLDVSSCRNLKLLLCDNNQLATLNVSGSTMLELLDCSYNQLISLDVHDRYGLTYLHCSNNRLQSLNIRNLFTIENLDCSYNQLTSLDLGKNTVTTFRCEGNAAPVDVATNDMTLDLTKLPGSFDPSRSSGWYNATLNGNVLRIRQNAGKITYVYDVDGEKGAYSASFAILPNYYYHSHSYRPVVQVSALKTPATDTEDAVYYYSCDCGKLSTDTFAAEGTAGSVAIDFENFPDKIFRKFVLDNIDKDENQLLSHDERNAVTSLDLGNGLAYDDSERIWDLTGIGYFTELKKLECSSNKLSALDLSKNTKLISLVCKYNDLVSLDLRENTLLTNLECTDNQLTSLDISNCTALQRLYCGVNKLSSLDLRQLPSLEEAILSGNKLQSLLVAGNTSITMLLCNSSMLTNLDVSDCTALRSLSCDGNQITQLNMQNCTVLGSIRCAENQLTTLDLSGCAALTYLRCPNNLLTSLDIGQCPRLTELYCQDNQLTSLDIQSCTDLSKLLCSNNQLTTLDVAGHSALKGLSCSYNQLKYLDLSGVSLRYTLECSGNTSTIFVREGIGEYDLSLMPKGFDPAKVMYWQGATVDGNVLKINPGATSVYYQYNSFGDGRYGSPTFTLRLQTIPPSDIDGNGSTNESDAIYLLWHTLFPQEYPLDKSIADFNDDGAVTDADALELLWVALGLVSVSQ